MRPRTMTRSGFLVALAIAIVLWPAAPRAQQAAPADELPALKATDHPALPADLSQLWMAPTGTRARTPRAASASEFAKGVKLEVDGDFAKALPIFSDPALQQGALARYAEYYKGLAELRTSRAAEARRTFQSV